MKTNEQMKNVEPSNEPLDLQKLIGAVYDYAKKHDEWVEREKAAGHIGLCEQQFNVAVWFQCSANNIIHERKAKNKRQARGLLLCRLKQFLHAHGSWLHKLGRDTWFDVTCAYQMWLTDKAGWQGTFIKWSKQNIPVPW